MRAFCVGLRWPLLVLLLASVIGVGAGTLQAADEVKVLGDRLVPWSRVVSGSESSFGLAGRIEADIDGERHAVDLRIVRYDDEAFDFEATHADYAVSIRRRAEGLALALPKHGVVYLGEGEVAESDSLAPKGITARLMSVDSSVATYVALVQTLGPSLLAKSLVEGLGASFEPERQAWRIGDVVLSFPAPERVVVGIDRTSITLERMGALPQPASLKDWSDYRSETLSRSEMERQLTRGVRRAFEVLAPAPTLLRPTEETRRVSHGELQWVEGQRVALLWGSPEEIGKAHGELLRVEAGRCIDSVLYAFGTVETVRSGKWFRHSLEEAYARLKPHIPERHLAETRAMAVALGESPETIEVVNVFPELFHCSGFAVAGSATVDGKLYHGRVLDYMTTIGLQDAATTLVVMPDGYIPFLNVGYAGFVGSVSGMNAERISLGEMGGRGEGRWDGVPMATLMRRALEECRSLDEVKRLWSESPRTCEYYYVFADGETREAVGVAAVPESLEFVGPGEGHELLGEGIPDAIVLSAGSRLETLRGRVTEKHGKIDAEVARWLMSRPVAMESNLHNVLFVPEDGVAWVANAGHGIPAAERPYVKFDLGELLEGIGALRSGDEGIAEREEE